jgi:hypothetical protein
MINNPYFVGLRLPYACDTILALLCIHRQALFNHCITISLFRSWIHKLITMPAVHPSMSRNGLISFRNVFKYKEIVTLRSTMALYSFIVNEGENAISAIGWRIQAF